MSKQKKEESEGWKDAKIPDGLLMEKMQSLVAQRSNEDNALVRYTRTCIELDIDSLRIQIASARAEIAQHELHIKALTLRLDAITSMGAKTAWSAQWKKAPETEVE